MSSIQSLQKNARKATLNADLELCPWMSGETTSDVDVVSECAAIMREDPSWSPQSSGNEWYDHVITRSTGFKGKFGQLIIETYLRRCGKEINKRNSTQHDFITCANGFRCEAKTSTFWKLAPWSFKWQHLHPAYDQLYFVGIDPRVIRLWTAPCDRVMSVATVQQHSGNDDVSQCDDVWFDGQDQNEDEKKNVDYWVSDVQLSAFPWFELQFELPSPTRK